MQFLFEPDGCAINKFSNIFRTRSVHMWSVVISHSPEFVGLGYCALQDITSPNDEPSFQEFCVCVFVCMRFLFCLLRWSQIALPSQWEFDYCSSICKED